MWAAEVWIAVGTIIGGVGAIIVPPMLYMHQQNRQSAREAALLQKEAAELLKKDEKRRKRRFKQMFGRLDRMEATQTAVQAALAHQDECLDDVKAQVKALNQNRRMGDAQPARG